MNVSLSGHVERDRKRGVAGYLPGCRLDVEYDDASLTGAPRTGAAIPFAC